MELKVLVDFVAFGQTSSCSKILIKTFCRTLSNGVVYFILFFLEKNLASLASI